MAIVEPDALPALLPKGSRLMGIDHGEKTLGLALSDSGLMVASPLQTLRRKKFTLDVQALFAVMDDRQVGGLVLGLPRNMDGSEGPRCQSVRQFAANLLQLRDIPVAFWDERLSTAAVERAMIQADESRAKRAQNVDKAAAAFILQGYLDFLAAQEQARQ